MLFLLQNRIRISKLTHIICNASILVSHWLSERPEEVMAKGKGLLRTYWCDPSTPNFISDGRATSSTMTSSETSSDNEFEI